MGLEALAEGKPRVISGDSQLAERRGAEVRSAAAGDPSGGTNVYAATLRQKQRFRGAWAWTWRSLKRNCTARICPHLHLAGRARPALFRAYASGRDRAHHSRGRDDVDGERPEHNVSRGRAMRRSGGHETRGANGTGGMPLPYWREVADAWRSSSRSWGNVEGAVEQLHDVQHLLPRIVYLTPGAHLQQAAWIRGYGWLALWFPRHSAFSPPATARKFRFV